MLPGFLLSFREGLEAALIIGIVLSALNKMNHQKLNSAVWIGISSAIGVCVLVALGLNWLSVEFEGRGEQLFEGITMILAASVITWIVFWMRNQSLAVKQKIEFSLNNISEGKGRRALFLLAFFAVIREGIELILFLLAIRLNTNPFQVMLGASLGLISAVLIGWLVFNSTRNLSLERFFRSTNILLAFFAAGLVSQGIHEFNELGWIPVIVENIWDLNAFIPDQSIVGQFLKALFGYTSSPSLSQTIGYIGYFCVLAWILTRKSQRMPLLEPMIKKLEQ